MQRDAIAILEKVQGEDDLGVVALLSNLAGFLQAQVRFTIKNRPFFLAWMKP